MQAASALPVHAIAPSGDGVVAPDASGASGDAFTSALAALMGVLGQARPAPLATAPPAQGASGQGATSSFFQLGGSAAAGAASASAAPSFLSDPASGALREAVLKAVITELEAAQRAAQALGAAPGQVGATAAGSAGAAQSPDPEDQLLALLRGLANQAAGDATSPGGSSPPTEVAGPVSAPDAPIVDASLDPRLISFVARGTAGPQTGSPAASDSPNAGDGAAATPPALAGEATVGAASDAQSGPTGAGAQAAPGAAQANPVAAGLIVFNPAGGQPAPAPQPPAANRPTASKTAASPAAPAIGSAKPGSPPDIRPAALAQLAGGRDDAGADARAADADPGPSSDPGQGGGDPSSGAPSGAAFELAAAPAQGAAAVVVPPAAAALAQAHGAEITAQLAAQIAARPGAVRSSFDFSLDPQGLGRVDVALKIDAQGGLSAVLSFDNPAVAAEARSRAGDLQQLLQQAGFDVSQSGLSFTANGGHGHGAAFQDAGHASHPAPVGGFAETAPPEPPTLAAIRARRTFVGGLDITI